MRKRCIAVNKDERSWKSEEYFDVRHGNTRVWSLPSWFSVQYFFTILPFRIIMYILCHYVEAHREEQQMTLELMECAYRFAQSWWVWLREAELQGLYVLRTSCYYENHSVVLSVIMLLLNYELYENSKGSSSPWLGSIIGTYNNSDWCFSSIAARNRLMIHLPSVRLKDINV